MPAQRRAAQSLGEIGYSRVDRPETPVPLPDVDCRSPVVGCRGWASGAEIDVACSAAALSGRNTVVAPAPSFRVLPSPSVAKSRVFRWQNSVASACARDHDVAAGFALVYTFCGRCAVRQRQRDSDQAHKHD